MTSLLTQIIEKHLTLHNILKEEQKGCRKKSLRCKEQLIIDSTILKQAEQHQRNLYTWYIDYKKAFDSVPHSWLQKVLQVYKIPNTLSSFLTHVMQTWRTKIYLHTDRQQIETDEIQMCEAYFKVTLSVLFGSASA